MMPSPLSTLALIIPVMALMSCAAPKAIVVEPPPAATQELVVAESTPEISTPPPSTPVLRDDGIRLPDMITMPQDTEFRATNPNVQSSNASTGAVIARPPTDPPTRPKSEAKGD